MARGDFYQLQPCLYTCKPKPLFIFLFIFIIYLYIFLWDFISNVFWQTRLTLREEVSLKKVLVFLCLFDSCRLIIKRAEEKKKKKNNPEHDLRGFLFTLFFFSSYLIHSRDKNKKAIERNFFFYYYYYFSKRYEFTYTNTKSLNWREKAYITAYPQNNLFSTKNLSH